MTRISSRELSEKMGLTASQIRQDLNCFGGFGQQGYGYNIELLQSEIARILGIDAPKSAILIGVGNLGKAITMHVNFESKGFKLIGLFDSKESLVGQMIKNRKPAGGGFSVHTEKGGGAAFKPAGKAGNKRLLEFQPL